MEMMPIGKGILVLPYDENPYQDGKTSEGFKTTDGEFINEDSGEKDKMSKTFICGKIVEVGQDCVVAREGDDVIYHINTTRPLPFMGMGLYLINEASVLTLIGENLKDRVKTAK